MTILSSVRCAFGWHAEAVRDQRIDGTRFLRCPRCFSVCGYPETDAAKIEQLRAEQQRQREALKIKQQWLDDVRGQ